MIMTEKRHKGRGRPRINKPVDMIMLRIEKPISDILREYCSRYDVSMSSVISKLIADNIK